MHKFEQSLLKSLLLLALGAAALGAMGCDELASAGDTLGSKVAGRALVTAPTPPQFIWDIDPTRVR